MIYWKLTTNPVIDEKKRPCKTLNIFRFGTRLLLFHHEAMAEFQFIFLDFWMSFADGDMDADKSCKNPVFRQNFSGDLEISKHFMDQCVFLSMMRIYWLWFNWFVAPFHFDNNIYCILHIYSPRESYAFALYLKCAECKFTVARASKAREKIITLQNTQTWKKNRITSYMCGE